MVPQGGYRGFYARNWNNLSPKVVNDIHKKGGTMLHTSRGGYDTNKIVNAIEDRGINQVRGGGWVCGLTVRDDELWRGKGVGGRCGFWGYFDMHDNVASVANVGFFLVFGWQSGLFCLGMKVHFIICSIIEYVRLLGNIW